MARQSPDEPTLQSWLIEAYTNREYGCYNLHVNERVNERGVDVECESKDEKLILCVKIKPIKKDIPQLRKFSEAAADRRSYVHWSTPTKEFQKELTRLGVASLTGSELTQFLIVNRSFGFLRWSLLQSSTVSMVTESLEFIYSSRANSERALERQDLVYIWRMKSSGVKLRATLTLLKNYFVQRLEKQADQEKAGQMTTEVFQAIEDANFASEELLATIKEVKEEAPHLLSKFLVRVSSRSGWIQLHAKINQSDKAIRQEIIEDWLVEPRESRMTSTFNWLNQALDDLEDKLSFFSEGVDWLFKSEWEGKFGKDFETHD